MVRDRNSKQRKCNFCNYYNTDGANFESDKYFAAAYLMAVRHCVNPRDGQEGTVKGTVKS
jgi:hypothetical protein